MDNSHDLELIINSRVPLIIIESHDEARLIAMLAAIAIRQRAVKYKPFFRWSVTDGLQRIDIDLEPQRHNAEPEDVLRHIRSVKSPGVYVMLDMHPYLKEPVNVRLLKDICIESEVADRTIILLSHEVDLPTELKSLSARFEMSMPDEKEREKIVRSVADDWVRDHPGRRVVTDKQAFRLLIRNLAGMTVADTRRLARNAIFNDGAISRSDIDRVMKAKYALLNRRGVLSYEYDTARFADIGGLNRLKEWVSKRKSVFVTAPDKKLDPPKGLMLLGVQGCGKSLAAKAIAGIFGVPLLRLDFGTLYNKYYGETERNLRESLKTAEVMEPCVLWIDEIEKGISQGSGDDSSLSRRVLGTFLTWIAEKTVRVFVVATANDITSLPPELVRKGRFDEIFFIDLPSAEIREEIFAIHLRNRDFEETGFDLKQLAHESDGFSGAEIEQALVSALYAAHANNEKLNTEHIVAEVSLTRPLSVTMAENIASLRSWAEDRTVPGD